MGIIFNKKAQFGMGVSKFTAIILGLLVLGAGVVGLLGTLGMLELPELPDFIFQVVVIIAGIIMLVEGFKGITSSSGM